MQKATMNAEQTAKYLGIDYRLLLRVAKKKQVPHVIIGRRIFFRKETLDLWMERQEENLIADQQV